jgi:hypothetical protein
MRFSRQALLASVLLVLFCGIAKAQNMAPVVSGYEIYLGRNCTVAGMAATCDAIFTGWTGIASEGGWEAFPGARQGAWSLQVNYTGEPAFGQSVTIVGGSWSFLFFDGVSLHGKVARGTVTWPANSGSTIMGSGCKAGEALGQAVLTLSSGGSGELAGCLHDLPKFSVIPPTVWGFFYF